MIDLVEVLIGFLRHFKYSLFSGHHQFFSNVLFQVPVSITFYLIVDVKKKLNCVGSRLTIKTSNGLNIKAHMNETIQSPMNYVSNNPRNPTSASIKSSKYQICYYLANPSAQYSVILWRLINPNPQVPIGYLIVNVGKHCS